MIKETLAIELHYLPCIQYFVYLESFSNVIIDLSDRYEKQTYRNRCVINGANNLEKLIIPTKKTHAKRTLTANIEIDYTQKWLSKHLRAIQSCYGKAPFFEFYVDDFFNIFNKKPCNLLDLNKELLTKCLEILDIKVDLNFEVIEFEKEKKLVRNARNEINPKNSISENAIFSPKPYFQVFGNNFANNMSIIDLVFCEGPQAGDIVRNSCVRQ